MGFEDRFSKVGRALDSATEKVRDTLDAGGGEPLVNTERAKERVGEWKQVAAEKATQWWEKYKTLPKFGAAAVALGGLCVVLLVTVIVMASSGKSDAPPSRAKADEIATMAALRAKMSPNASSSPAPRR